MTNRIDYEGAKIDDSSQICLKLLKERGDLSTRRLRDETPEDSGDILYRLNKLADAGLVEKAGEVDRPGANNTHLWTLTPDGDALLKRHSDKITDAVTAATALKDVHRLESQLAEVRETADRAESQANSNKSNISQVRNNRIAGLDDDIDGLEEEIEEVWEDLEESEQDIDAIQTWIRESGAHEDDVASGEERVDDLKTEVSEIADDLESLETRVAESFKIVDAKLSKLHSRVEDLEDEDAARDDERDGGEEGSSLGIFS